MGPALTTVDAITEIAKLRVENERLRLAVAGCQKPCQAKLFLQCCQGDFPTNPLMDEKAEKADLL